MLSPDLALSIRECGGTTQEDDEDFNFSNGDKLIKARFLTLD